MRLVRSALILFLAATAGACRPKDDCYAPRTGDETTCAVFDTMGWQWTISPDQPIRDLDTFCAASCIDVLEGHVNINGYPDLREVPLLAKFRTVQDLDLDVEGLRDLRGLEGVDIVGTLKLSTHGADMFSFKSLDGLSDRALTGVFFKQVMGVEDFDGARFDRLDALMVEDAALRRIDLSSLSMEHLSLIGASELTSLRVGSGVMGEASIMSASQLTGFSWVPGLKVRNFNIQNNSQLSSCLVADFVEATNLGLASSRLVANNGPCP